MSGILDFLTSPIATPGDVRRYQDKVNGEVLALWADVLPVTDATKNIPPAQWKTFQSWVEEWKAFYRETEPVTARLFDGVIVQTEDYEKKLIEWRRLFAKLGVSVSGPEPAEPPNRNAPEKASPNLNLLVTAAVVLGVAWFASSVASGARAVRG